VLQVGSISLGVLICFEVAFDDRVRDVINAGATILAVPSNNATYQGTAQPGQQLEIARFRALETGRAVLVASTTGVSAIVDRQGDVTASLEDGGAGVLVGSVTASTEVTAAVRWGGALGGVLGLVAFASLAMGTRRSLQSRNDRRRG
jgi:apolipoprotein N-acyltransferase